MKKVAILAHDNLTLFEFGCAVELFSLERPLIKNWYQTDVITFENGPLRATGNITIEAEKINTLDPYDMLVVPSWPSVNSEVPENIKKEVLALLERGGRVVAFCSGIFLPAEIGLFNGRKAITHWIYADIFKEKFPLAEYVDDILYLFDGTIGCSAGSSAAIDLGLEVIRKDYGYKICNQVARRLVIAPHRDGGQSQFVETPVSSRPNKFSETLDWAIDNLTVSLDVNALSARANMSRRTFDRKFRAAMNMSPKEWLISQKLNLAKSLLESTVEPIEVIATSSGFENPMTLRHHFKKCLKISPSQYRKLFGIDQYST